MLKLLRNIFRRPTLALDYAGTCDIGRVRKNNEDSFGVIEEKNLFMVADGMGGHNGGEVASQATIEIMRHYFTDQIVKAMRGSSQETRHAMINSFDKANDVVMALSRDDENLLGMGCTLVMAFISGTNLYTCHVGDTRCYIISQGKIRQITTDHTVAAESPEIMHNRNVVTRVIGYSFPEPPEFNRANLQAGDKILLCSDGLWSMIDDETMCKTITEASSPEDASKRLIAIANQAGGSDNSTALIIFCG